MANPGDTPRTDSIEQAVQTATPVGTILPFAGTVIPAGFLLCNGAQLDNTVYSALFAVIGTSWGTTGGVNFNLPNAQGLFLRGVANGSSFDLDRNSRTALASGGAIGDNVGSYQSNRFGSHSHTVGSHTHAGPSHRHTSGGPAGVTTDTRYVEYGSVLLGANRFAIPTSAYTFYSSNIARGHYTSYSAGTTGASSATGGTSGGNQTAPNNINVNYIIKY